MLLGADWQLLTQQWQQGKKDNDSQSSISRLFMGLVE